MSWCMIQGYNFNAWLGRFTVRDVRYLSARRCWIMLCVIESETTFKQDSFHFERTVVMRITDLALTRCRRHRDIWERWTVLAIVVNVDLHYACFAIACVQEENQHVILIKHRTRHIRNAVLNTNVYCKQQALRDSMFKVSDISMLSHRIDWPRVIDRNAYRCAPMADMCSFLYSLATAFWWADYETKFGLFISQLSQSFLENMSNLWTSSMTCVCT